MRTYHLVVFEAEEGGFWGEVAELPGCVAQGESLDELMTNTRTAIEVFIETMEEDGEEQTRDRFVANMNLELTPA